MYTNNIERMLIFVYTFLYIISSLIQDLFLSIFLVFYGSLQKVPLPRLYQHLGKRSVEYHPKIDSLRNISLQTIWKSVFFREAE